ncbi:DUF423 domain-containing protein [Salinivibrio sp. YCSC6]|uniref:DUF423 domain-containing protein n=1 Tax=Salinivibrio sp. YCSC6 TaxID=2003370 RepID=UPI000BBC275E|nr:DUF423 domain-containing protein [Salinivibrio sp. YCSC6]PCE69047.1 hypothetical protein B6G00_12540 [Salinivibrio sp. YCSC6]QCF36525.1 DUF423 domain-containing protein [Salinivibrio sp. YCSC6]
MRRQHWIISGALGAGLAVALGAFAAHGLKATLNNYELAIFKTGVNYQMWHSLALLCLGAVAPQLPERCVVTTGIAWWVGILCFSGSLYLLALTHMTWLGPVTPLGGLSFLVGWGALAFGAWRAGRQ